MAITLITCLYMLIQAIYVTSVGILSIRIRALPDAFSEIDDMTPHFLFIKICHNTKESNGIQIYNAMGEGKYLNLWKQKLSIILSTIEKGGNEEGLKLSAEEFKQSGDRPSAGYGFRLDIVNGFIPPKSGSAVARDLKETLDSEPRFKKIAQNKKITIKMGVGFLLKITVINITANINIKDYERNQ